VFRPSQRPITGPSENDLLFIAPRAPTDGLVAEQDVAGGLETSDDEEVVDSLLARFVGIRRAFELR
jgi:hypothetical protein